MELAYFLLLITCILYGASGIIKEWGDFFGKLINTIVLIVLFVLYVISVLNEGGSVVWWWVESDNVYTLCVLASPCICVYIGARIHNLFKSSDWEGVCAILSLIGLIATIVITCINV